jgi:glycerol transport system ATP-binding protein
MPFKNKAEDDLGRPRLGEQGNARPHSRASGALMLELQDIGRTVGGETHLAGVSLELRRGGVSVLLGPTLAGKTSLMRVMAGLDPPTSGRVTLDGVDVTKLSVRKRSVAMVYQQFVNYPGLRVRGNIASPLEAQKLGKPDIEARVAQAAKMLRLEPFLDRRPHELSGGQQQRVALARAIVKQADLVVLDEPLANLDYKLREELRAELPKFFAGSKSIVVFATTDPVEALLLGGDVATMSEGRVTQFGRGLDVYRRPKDLVTARTFSDPPLNVLRVQAAGGKTQAVGEGVATLPAMPDGAWTLAFRPHHLKPGAGPAGAARFTLKIVSTEVTGSESFVHAMFGTSRWVLLTHGVHLHRAGEILEAHVEPKNIMTFDVAGASVALEAA